jgi:hypothetical protein
MPLFGAFAEVFEALAFGELQRVSIRCPNQQCDEG